MADGKIVWELLHYRRAERRMNWMSNANLEVRCVHLVAVIFHISMTRIDQRTLRIHSEKGRGGG